MCGILGTVNKAFDNEILDLIKHRGPDDGDIKQLTMDDNTVYLGHRRLSIQDLSLAGHQPMLSACGNFVIVFNGEVYNHLVLREKLTHINFNGHSDTETIVNYIANFGIQSVNEFNGIFAFCVVDIQNKKLYLVRDRYGIKPIYYCLDNKDLLFSSEMRPLKKLTNTTIDLDNLHTLLKLRYSPSPTTLLDSIKKLRPGHILEYDLINYQIHLSSFITPVKINKSLSFDAALDQYAQLFEQAVKRQLLADVEVGILLSGGIDSALVAYYAQKYSDKPIKTFTIGFSEDDAADETVDARETARIIGTEHFDVKINSDDFESIFKNCIGIVEEPLATTSIIPMYYLNKLVHEHVKVVLTGQGADEPLGGYTRYQGEIWRNRLPAFIFELLKPLGSLFKNESLYRGLYALGENDTCKRFECIYALFRDEEIYQLIGKSNDKSLEAICYFYDLLEGKNKDSVNAMMSNDIRMNLADDLLLYTDKISMHFSIEARVPMLDNDLIDFVESLPLEYKITGKNGKYIHKKFAEKVLPKEIVYRAKKGFKSPTEKWFQGEKGVYFKELLTQKNTHFSRLFDIEAVGMYFNDHLSHKRNLEKKLFMLISIYFWMDYYDK